MERKGDARRKKTESTGRIEEGKVRKEGKKAGI